MGWKLHKVPVQTQESNKNKKGKKAKRKWNGKENQNDEKTGNINEDWTHTWDPTKK